MSKKSDSEGHVDDEGSSGDFEVNVVDCSNSDSIVVYEEVDFDRFIMERKEAEFDEKFLDRYSSNDALYDRVVNEVHTPIIVPNFSYERQRGRRPYHQIYQQQSSSDAQVHNVRSDTGRLPIKRPR